MTTFEKFQRVKEMITQLFVHQIILFLKENYKFIAIDLSKNKHQMLIQKQFNKLISLKIQSEVKVKQCYSLLKKQKKPFRFLQQGRRERGRRGKTVFLMRYIEIFRHLLSKCFKNAVLGVKKWCSANISSDNKQKHAEKFIKSESFLAVLRVDIIFNVK